MGVKKEKQKGGKRKKGRECSGSILPDSSILLAVSFSVLSIRFQIFLQVLGVRFASFVLFSFLFLLGPGVWTFMFDLSSP
jgi:hypothetical protein